MASPRVRSAASNLAMRAGIAALVHTAGRVLPQKPVKHAPAPGNLVLKLAAPVAALVGAGAAWRVLYRRSEERRKRRAARRLPG